MNNKIMNPAKTTIIKTDKIKIHNISIKEFNINVKIKKKKILLKIK